MINADVLLTSYVRLGGYLAPLDNKLSLYTPFTTCRSFIESKNLQVEEILDHTSTMLSFVTVRNMRLRGDRSQPQGKQLPECNELPRCSLYPPLQLVKRGTSPLQA